MAPTPIYADLPPNDGSINITTKLLDCSKKNTDLKLLNDVDLALSEFARLNSSSGIDFLEKFFRNPKVCAISLYNHCPMLLTYLFTKKGQEFL